MMMRNVKVGEYGDPEKGIILVRTSDRGTWRRCRRRFAWNSALGENLEANTGSSPLWLGTGFHFALEDFHGYRNFPYMSQALQAYADATNKANPSMMPDNWEEDLELGRDMADYYQEHWLRGRPGISTLWIDDKPQVEVSFEILLPIVGPNGEAVYYQGSIDRVAQDEYGLLWIVEYKTAKQFATGHFMIDPQVTAYTWAGNQLYQHLGMEIQGVVYQQHLKAAPRPPRFLKTRGKLSVDKKQATTHRLYREALIALYGHPNKAPAANIEFMNWLAAQETECADKFVRRDFIYRNGYQLEAEGVKVLQEIPEMIDPDTPMYPSPTRDCMNMCPFFTACVSYDDGSDWEQEIEQSTRKRDESEHWRKYIEYPA